VAVTVFIRSGREYMQLPSRTGLGGNEQPRERAQRHSHNPAVTRRMRDSLKPETLR
jgi:hypothetical protein